MIKKKSLDQNKVSPLLLRVHGLSGLVTQRIANFVAGHFYLTGFAGTALAVAMTCLLLVSVHQGRVEVLERASDNSRNLVLLMSRSLAREIGIYDRTLLDISNSSGVPAIWESPEVVRNAAFFSGAARSTYVIGTRVLDSDHHVRFSDQLGCALDAASVDHNYLKFQSDQHLNNISISHPYRCQLQDRKWVVDFSRRIEPAIGRLSGVVVLSVDFAFFQDLLDEVETGRAGSAFVALDDGTLLARKPLQEDDVGVSIAKSPMFTKMRTSSSGTYSAMATVDGVKRLYTYQHVPGTHLIAVVAPAVEDVLAIWKRRSVVVAAITELFAAIVTVISWSLAFSLRAKVTTQEELTRLAATDPLTGLGNRRLLDRRLDEEWQRAKRSDLPLTVVFVDIDHFKFFNDEYGHATGDEVLVKVADCIKSVAKRAVDVAVRYGGEEFALVLRDTSPDRAMELCETIRTCVENLRLHHKRGLGGTVTVSIGSATWTGASIAGGNELLEFADAMLYESKSGGRNLVRSAILERNIQNTLETAS